MSRVRKRAGRWQPATVERALIGYWGAVSMRTCDAQQRRVRRARMRKALDAAVKPWVDWMLGGAALKVQQREGRR